MLIILPFVFVVVIQVKSGSYKMFDELATCDDLAYMILVIEQFFRKWQKKLVLKVLEEKGKSSSSSSNKKPRTRRNVWNQYLVYKDGNGLSGKDAQERLTSLRKYIGGEIKKDQNRHERAEGHFIEAWREWQDQLGKKDEDDEAKENEECAIPLPSPEEEEMNDIDLEEFANIVMI